MTLYILWIQLGFAALLILGASTYLAKSADVITLKTGLGRSFVGVVLLATATSLPELGTGVSSIVLVGEVNLAAGDAFGSNMFNLLIIGLLDLFWRDGPILNKISTTAVLVASLSIVVIGLAAAAIIIHDQTNISSGWYVSPVSIVILLIFFVAMYMTYRFEKSQPKDHKVEDSQYENDSLIKAVIGYSLSATVVVISAIWLADSGHRVAIEMGWDASFMGTQFLAFSTSLPEMSAGFAAIRIRAPELAISGVLGSNVFNMGFVLFVDDLAYTTGAIWTELAQIHVVTAVVAIIMTAVVVIALIDRNRQRPHKNWTYEAITLIALYVVASVLVFGLT